MLLEEHVDVRGDGSGGSVQRDTAGDELLQRWDERLVMVQAEEHEQVHCSGALEPRCVPCHRPAGACREPVGACSGVAVGCTGERGVGVHTPF